MRLYSYGACSTCRKALSWLAQQGHVVETIDITTQPPTTLELRLALDQLGRKALLNTSGKRYRELGAASIAAMDDEQLLELLAVDGRLIKRPVLITDDQRIVTGFKLEAWQTLLG